MIAALAAPEVAQQLTPENIAQQLDVSLEAAGEALSAAQSFANWAIHSAGLTEQEGYEGWIPVLELAYVAWKLQIQPVLTFTKAFLTEAFALMNDLRKWANAVGHSPAAHVVGDIVTGDWTGLAIDATRADLDFLHWLGLSPFGGNIIP